MKQAFSEGSWKNCESSIRNEYPGQGHDDLYIEMLRTDQDAVASYNGTADGSNKKKITLKIIGIILTRPSRALRKGLGALAARNSKDLRP